MGIILAVIALLMAVLTLWAVKSHQAALQSKADLIALGSAYLQMNGGNACALALELAAQNEVHLVECSIIPLPADQFTTLSSEGYNDVFVRISDVSGAAQYFLKAKSRAGVSDADCGLLKEW
jgi:hypothetical protein